ncbi:hypothetical protein FD14_GL002565 [Secundilactobacillus similis DSM 23365 = JCM 2765]|uniref:Uncharacterized protein n=4 Tax=Secundilactobacillus similis TaxID=414682 RepID=A0A0R2FDI0_9LACO|nr:hypothetical protein FD14_GL002565 [Secundilactobacillus similis DSM 23365 = JCM 2765]
MPLLKILEKLFVNSGLETDLTKDGREYPEMPVFVLRNQIIQQINVDYKLNDYKTKIRDPDIIEEISEMKQSIAENGGEINVSLTQYK